MGMYVSVMVEFTWKDVKTDWHPWSHGPIMGDKSFGVVCALKEGEFPAASAHSELVRRWLTEEDSGFGKGCVSAEEFERIIIDEHKDEAEVPARWRAVLAAISELKTDYHVRVAYMID